jgi:outer membrane protein OmpA-like peptidoglycan-associated protein
MRSDAILFMALFLSLSALPALAQQGMTSEDFIGALGGRQLGSGDLSAESIISTLEGNPHLQSSPAGDYLFDELREKEATRSFTIKEREEVEKFSAERPKVSIEVFFDYNSAEIANQAKPMLDKLGLALQDPRLAGKRFIFGGHTDARGDPNYNLHLSDRRAESVKRYIVSHFVIDERNITLIGHGARVLKNSANPFDGENRRVEVVRSN